MARSADKIQNALDEARTLILGVQVLIGFGLRAHFEPGFARLRDVEKTVSFISLCLLLFTFAILLLPTTTHRLVEHGEDTARLQRVTNSYIAVGLGIFALAIGGSAYGAITLAMGLASAVAIAATVTVLCLVLWFAVGLAHRQYRGDDMEEKVDATLADKIKQVLTEARVILPGAQALLGFALTATFTDKFAELQDYQKDIHVFGILLCTLAAAILMLPAAYHRLAERGEESEHFHGIAGRCVLAALPPLVASIGCELFVVLSMGMASNAVSLGISIGMTGLILAILFGLPFALAGRPR